MKLSRAAGLAPWTSKSNVWFAALAALTAALAAPTRALAS